jgi:hypothetical protein
VAGLDQIGHDRAALVDYEGAERNRKDEILASPTMSQISLSVSAVARAVMRLTLITEQGANAGIGLDYDVATSAAVATLRSTFGPSPGAQERDDSGATIAGA